MQLNEIPTGSTQPVPNEAHVQRILAQYPAQRTAGVDNKSMLYKNGLLFTAHTYTKNTSSSLKSFRDTKKVFSKNVEQVNKDATAILIMPRSMSNNDVCTQKYNDVKDSVLGKGGGIVGGLSNVISDMLFKAIDNHTGFINDNNEQMYTATRSLYQGANNREKTFSWHLTPQNDDDLAEIFKIYSTFLYLSYGNTKMTSMKEAASGMLSDVYSQLGFKSATTIEGSIAGTVTDFLTNVNVVNNPTLWTVQTLYSSDLEARIDYDDLFGPANITAVRFDRSPDGNFTGLNKYPNISSTYVLEVTMRESIALDRGSIDRLK